MAKEKVLIIDDQAEVGETLKEWLEKFGYEVTYRSDGAQGLEAMKNDAYPVVLLDIKMPGDDGITVLKKIKELAPMSAIILMTAYPSDNTITQALSNGAYDYLLKPFNMEKIQFLVERAFSYHNLLKSTKKRSK